MEKLKTVKEIAKWLNLSEWRVYDLVKQGILPAIHLGRKQLRFDPNSLENWIKAGGSVQHSEKIKK